jgi:hypothetical protein
MNADRGRSLATLVGVSLLPAAGRGEAQTVVEREPWRPPALQPDETCDVYTGWVGGNDPTKLVEMRICQDGALIRGEAQYSGENSGWSLRCLEGAWSDGGEGLVLHELTILDQKPSPGLHVCTVDRYVFAKSQDASVLTGPFDSAACGDRGWLSLRLTGTVHRTLELRHAQPPSATQPTAASRRACSCRVAGNGLGVTPPPACLAFFTLFALLARTRRSWPGGQSHGDGRRGARKTSGRIVGVRNKIGITT